MKNKEIELENLNIESVVQVKSNLPEEDTTKKTLVKSKKKSVNTKTRQTQNELLTECSDILMQNQCQPENLLIQSMTQLNYVLQSLTNHRKERILNDEKTMREELPFSMATDAKKLAEAIATLMRPLNESRKIRSSTYLKLKELKNEEI
jgi:hypothetical protein